MFLFSGNARILFKTTAMEGFFYSIIASCLIEFLASRCLTLSISKQDDSVHSIPLRTGGHRSGRIPSAAGGEEVQRWRCGDGRSRCAPSSRSRRWRGRRSSAPLFIAVVWADPARPPKRHLALLRYNFLYWSSSLGHCVRDFFYATTPQLPIHSS